MSGGNTHQGPGTSWADQGRKQAPFLHKGPWPKIFTNNRMPPLLAMATLFEESPSARFHNVPHACSWQDVFIRGEKNCPEKWWVKNLELGLRSAKPRKIFPNFMVYNPYFAIFSQIRNRQRAELEINPIPGNVF